MANQERTLLDRLVLIYGSSRAVANIRPATPLEIQKQILTSQDRLDELSFSFLVNQFPPSPEDIAAKGDRYPQITKNQEEEEEALRLAIENVFKEISLWPDFPYQKCDQASRFLASRLDGFRVVMGWFHLDQPLGLYLPSWKKPIEPHTWNTDPWGRIVDLTAFQFNKGLNDPLPEKPIIIEPDCLLSTRYQKAISEY